MKTISRTVQDSGALGWGLALGLIVGLATLAGCDSTEPDPPRAVELSISPDSVTFTAFEDTARFVATLTDQFGDPFVGTVTWSSSAPDFFTVDTAGLVTSVANGAGIVLATYDSLRAQASVTVDVNLPPFVTLELNDFLLSVGGGPLGFQPAAFFDDPDDDVLDLTFTTSLSDSAVAETEVVTDSEGHVAILVTGTGVGTTELTVAATDPGGLSADQSLTVAVDDEGYTPVPGVLVSNDRIEVSGLALASRCSPPLNDFTTGTGTIITINTSGWHTRVDSTAEWTSIEETERDDGRLCPHNTSVGGEYRLVFNMTSQIDEHHDPFSGNYRSQNTFTVVDTATENQAPVLDTLAFTEVTLGSRGGPIPFVAGRFLTDPDGDTLTFAITNSDSAAASAVMTIDSLGHHGVVLTGRAEGSSVVTLTATDPEGLSTDWEIDVTVEDSGFTPWYAVLVGNGVLIAFGFELSTCMPPVIDLESVDGNVYTIHASKWQSRADSTEEWSDVEGTERTDGRVCPYSTDEAGDYRLVYEMSILYDPDLDPTRGWYRSPNYFTVSDDDSVAAAAAAARHAPTARPKEAVGMARPRAASQPSASPRSNGHS